MTSIRGIRRAAFQTVKRGTISFLLRPSGLKDEQLFDPAIEKSRSVVGSGFLVDVGDKVVALTARHVVRDIEEIQNAARHYEKEPPEALCLLAQETYFDKDNDHAVRIPHVRILDVIHYSPIDVALVELGPLPRGAWKPLTLAENSAETGDEVGCCGFPLSRVLQFSRYHNAIFSAGIVSTVLPDPSAKGSARGRLQIDALVHGGASGGPVFDPLSGEVLGMVVKDDAETAVRYLKGGAPVRIPLGLGFAEDVWALRAVVRSYAQRRPEEKVGQVLLSEST